MRKLDLDKMDEDIEDPGHRDSYDDQSERSIISDDEDDEDEDMLVPGSSGPTNADRSLVVITGVAKFSPPLVRL